MGLGALGSTVVAVACVPKVSATLVVDETRTPDHQQFERAPTTAPKPAIGSDRGPPQVVRAELAGGATLRIYFSEPVAAVEGFDPADFRISALFLSGIYGYTRTGAYSTQYADYYDPGEMYYGAPIRPVTAQLSGDRADISFSPEIAAGFCDALAMSYGDSYRDASQGSAGSGLFLHYAAGQIPIRDADGNPLENFGADWVIGGRGAAPETTRRLAGEAASAAGEGLVRIACGPPIPPGPR